MPRIKVELPDTFVYSTDIDVRVTDMNYGAHLGNDTLVSLLHEARARFFRHFGMQELDIHGAGIVIADLAVQYRAEAFFGDRLSIDVALNDFSRVGFDMVYRVRRDADGKDIAYAKTGIVCFDYTARQACPVPEPFVKQFKTDT